MLREAKGWVQGSISGPVDKLSSVAPLSSLRKSFEAPFNLKGSFNDPRIVVLLSQACTCACFELVEQLIISQTVLRFLLPVPHERDRIRLRLIKKSTFLYLNLHFIGFSMPPLFGPLI